ncbi:class I SAM-dependent methyltransferase [Hymenobacter oligotrophus]|uniref:Class I SAM-dependent methyltransferase n=1 Tax=Hymenobacter oligotrophus TaxID=2319843 RepID=A0A3B7RUT5_9BACT|nr:class I SAM-dependent methyltransferase [Hymenobacter oligotrophus]AYA38097.1 class I SAM-dependent methyltransferase [Hymenobacter oligotrophus]
MDIRYEAQYHLLEEKHWWFEGRRDFVFSLVQQLGLAPTASILEIGCSGGPLMLRMRDKGFSNLTGIDISPRAIALAQQRGLPSTSVMDAAHLDFEDEKFDLIIASDVLEHIEDEAQALREWHRVLKPGGRLLVFVPAFPVLWSQHDVVNHHFRRYTRETLLAALRTSAFGVSRSSYWNGALFAPALLVRSLQRLLQPSKAQSQATNASGDLAALPKPLNSTLLGLLRLENAVLNRLNFPVGMSVFAVAHKPSCPAA